ncbi:TPA: helix-turn-helix transcriptional regulator [Clostridioides difficile]|uniref:helix-turn-helix transcriptional regulator n=1 Tax=Clostridioides difficile TaxID=1496 RepID=UPI0010281DDF|nr:helix-turn-helix transcriptional regulator [Clostridioides difficile]VFG59670.1 DNA-binding phage protein [Clostridioides difficile]VFG63915.1 DNA-binding phage protein [Clostridioides difficile]VIH55358.1 DNA-binding phage protein [Clostridioides difficile]VIJ29256.1 DNA-binding phage protein [Clostridioides difficile]VIN32840.1 DNA-binding phage protein [Clostridioides difficile]
MNRKLKAVRVEIGLTQKQLAELINMPLSTYRKKEQGQTQFTIKEASKIAYVLNKNPTEIFFNQKVTKKVIKGKNILKRREIYE